MKKIHPSVYVAEGARVVGDVTLGENCSVWCNAVIRADQSPVILGKECNVQDNVVIHEDEVYSVTIGDRVSIGHGSILHGCNIGDNSIIGMGSILLNGVTIGKNCLIGAGSLLTGGMQVPDGSVVYGSPAKIMRKASEKDLAYMQKNAEKYIRLAAKARASEEEDREKNSEKNREEKP